MTTVSSEVHKVFFLLKSNVIYQDQFVLQVPIKRQKTADPNLNGSLVSTIQ